MEEKNTFLLVQEQARTIQVVDAASRNAAAAFVITVKGMIKERTAYHEPLTKKAYETWQEARNMMKNETDPMKEAVQITENQIRAYDERVRADREAEEARLRAEAEAERNKIEKQIEKAHAKNDLDKVESLTEKAASIIDPTLNKGPARVKTSDGGSLSGREDIEVSIVDPKAVIDAISRGEIPITVVDFKLATLKQWIKSAGLKQVPGVSIKPATKYTVRTGGSR